MPGLGLGLDLPRTRQQRVSAPIALTPLSSHPSQISTLRATMALRSATLLAAAASSAALAAAAPLPHLMYLLVDDWGHADVGCESHRKPALPYPTTTQSNRIPHDLNQQTTARALTRP